MPVANRFICKPTIGVLTSWETKRIKWRCIIRDEVSRLVIESVESNATLSGVTLSYLGLQKLPFAVEFSPDKGIVNQEHQRCQCHNQDRAACGYEGRRSRIVLKEIHVWIESERVIARLCDEFGRSVRNGIISCGLFSFHLP